MTTSQRMEDRTKRTTLWYDLVLDDDASAAGARCASASRTSRRAPQVPVHRYTSREWHLLEREHLWRKVWQMACREENIPEVGSYVVYDIAGDSYLVVRTRDGIKAYVNACLHRGRALKDYDGRCSEFRCSFHGFTWRLDGTPALHAGAGRVPRDRGRPRRLAAARRPRSGSGAGSSSSTPTRTPSRSRTSSARCPSTSPAGTSSTATCRPTSRRRSGATGRSPRRRSTRGCTSAPRIPSPRPTSATRTPRSTSTATTRGRSARPARRSRTCPVEAQRGRHPQAHARRARGRGPADPVLAAQHGPRRDGRGRPRALAPGARRRGGRHLRRRARRPLELHRCSRTCTRGAATTASSTGSGRTATGTTSRSSRSCS